MLLGCWTCVATVMSWKTNTTPASFSASLFPLHTLLPLMGSEVDNHPRRCWRTLIAVAIFSKKNFSQAQMSILCNFLKCYTVWKERWQINREWKMLLVLSCSVTEDLNVHQRRTQAFLLKVSKWMVLKTHICF